MHAVVVHTQRCIKAQVKHIECSTLTEVFVCAPIKLYICIVFVSRQIYENFLWRLEMFVIGKVRQLQMHLSLTDFHPSHMFLG